MKQRTMPPGEEERAFIRETIKPKKGRTWRTLAKWLLLAFVCGCAAGGTFWLLIRYVSRPEHGPVYDETTGSQSQEETTLEEPVTKDLSDQILSELTEGLDQHISREVAKALAQELSQGEEMLQAAAVYRNFREASMVTVTNIRRDVDWLQNPREQETDCWGVILEITREQILLLANGQDLVDAADLRVVIAGQEIDRVSVLAQDSISHMSVLAVDMQGHTIPEGIEEASLGSSYGMRLGEPVVAVGAPLGQYASVNVGTLSWKDTSSVSDGELNILYTNMNRVGDSGLLLNMSGQVVGWLTNFHAEGTEELLAAVGISELTTTIEHLKSGSKTSQLGVLIQAVPEEVQQEQGVPAGLYVTGLEEGSPAAVSGIQQGDIITGIGDTSLVMVRGLQQVLMQATPGQQVEVSIMRWSREGYTQMVVPVVLGTH